MVLQTNDCKTYAQMFTVSYLEIDREQNDKMNCSPFQENYYNKWDAWAEEVPHNKENIRIEEKLNSFNKLISTSQKL